MQIYHYLNELVGAYILGVIISMGIGLIIGLEREFDKLKEKGFAGIRTFPIVTILGFTIGNLTTHFSSLIVIIGLSSFIIFLALYHFSQKQEEYGQGLTTDLALIATFILGVMVSTELYREAVATSVLIVTLLSLKTRFHSVISNITSEELFAFIKFSIIALLILPFLPNKQYGPDNLLNPFEIGSIIVIVSFLNFIGYFLVKYVGSEKGIILTAILGGLISSTVVTWNYASKSKETPELSKKYSAGIVIASAIMFPRLALIAYIFNNEILKYLIMPFGLLIMVCIIATLILMRRHGKRPETDIKLGNPLNMLNAIGFGAVYVIILFAVFYSNQFFGERGLYYSGLIAGLAVTEAITISMAKFSLDGENLNLAASVIISAIMSNMLVKLIITIFKGSKKTVKMVSYAFGSVIVIGTLYLLL